MDRAVKLKLLVAIGAMAVAVSLSKIALDPFAANYEISVYDGYSVAVWILLLGALFLGQIVIFESRRPDGRYRYWRWGFALLLIANAVLLLIPAVRYHLWARGDMLTYIGMIREIDELGLVPRSNYYPNVHLLALTFSYATGIAPSKVINVLPPVISIFHVVSLYLLLKFVFSDPKKLLFVLPVTSLLITGEHGFFHPSVFAFMLLPFVLYLLFRGYGRRSSYRFKVLLLIAVVSLVFYHPVVTLFFTGILVALKLSVAAGQRITAGVRDRENTSVIAASLAFVLFFSWYYSFDSIVYSTLAVVYQLLGVVESTSTYENLSGVFARTSPRIVDIALTGIYIYGLIGAVLAMGFVFAGYYAFLVARGRRRFDPFEAFLGSLLLIFTFGGLVAFFVNVKLGFYRIVRYARLAGAILIGAGFYTLFRRVQPRIARRYVRPVIYVSFFTLAFLSVFLLYGSPLSNDGNNQITEAEVEGTEWLFEYRNRSLLIDQLGIKQYRMYNYDRSTKRWGQNIRRDVPPPPMHFAYGNASLEDVPSGAADHRRYLIVTRLGRMRNPRFYPDYPRFWRHTPEDFARLERDPSVSHVYDDGTFDTYVVRGVGNKTVPQSRNASRDPRDAGRESEHLGTPSRLDVYGASRLDVHGATERIHGPTERSSSERVGRVRFVTDEKRENAHG